MKTWSWYRKYLYCCKSGLLQVRKIGLGTHPKTNIAPEDPSGQNTFSSWTTTQTLATQLSCDETNLWEKVAMLNRKYIFHSFFIVSWFMFQLQLCRVVLSKCSLLRDVTPTPVARKGEKRDPRIPKKWNGIPVFRLLRVRGAPKSYKYPQWN